MILAQRRLSPFRAPADAQKSARHAPRRLAAALGFALSLPGLPAPAQDAALPDGLVGAYLGAYTAELSGDVAAAARLYADAVRRDADNRALLGKAMIYGVISGDVGSAVDHARTLETLGVDEPQMQLLFVAEEIRAGAFPNALDRLEARRDAFPPFLQATLAGWSASVDDLEAADAAFDGVEGMESVQRFTAWHKAMAHAVADDLEGAAAILEATEPGPLIGDARIMEGWAQVLAATGRQTRALELLAEAQARGLDDSAIRALRDRITDGEAVSFTHIPNATVGVAEAMYGYARALAQGDRAPLLPMYLARLALHLDPGNAAARLLLADLFDQSAAHELAIAVLSDIPADSPDFLRAEIGRAGAMISAGRSEEAIGVLTGLSRAHPGQIAPVVALGDALRREERWTPCAEAYSRALALIGETVQSRHWILFYRRGICHERADMWPAAEADFRRALELEPDQPYVLNYLGYSMVELGRNLAEAEAMIRKAVELAPDDGYIIDSLAWVLYRLGRYEEAVEPMERAVSIIPFDPILNDHLGDILWMVGRKMEARFQWKRALSFEPEEDEVPRIRRKLEVGLDRVLEEERAEVPPPGETGDDG